MNRKSINLRQCLKLNDSKEQEGFCWRLSDLGPYIRGVTAISRAVSGEKQIYSRNLEILPGTGEPRKYFGKYDIFSGN